MADPPHLAQRVVRYVRAVGRKTLVLIVDWIVEQLDRRAAEDRADLAQRVARYAGGVGLATLAPVFEWVVERLDFRPPEPAPAPDLHGWPVPARAPQRLAIRKALAFDEKARWRLWWTLGGTGSTALFVVLTLSASTESGWETGVFFYLVSGLVTLAFLGAAVARLYGLRRAITRSIVVPAREVAVQRCATREKGIYTAVVIEYEYQETTYHVRTESPDVLPLVGRDPEMLVDPLRPGAALIRHFYTCTLTPPPPPPAQTP
jgi:hypothetical protein